MNHQEVFKDIDRIERELIDERVALAERRVRYEQRRAWGPFAALIVCLIWWAVGIAAAAAGHGWRFVVFNVVVVIAVVLWVRAGRQK